MADSGEAQVCLRSKVRGLCCTRRIECYLESEGDESDIEWNEHEQASYRRQSQTVALKEVGVELASVATKW
jgi:hypothetical protein